MTPFFNDTKNILSVTPENKFVSLYRPLQPTGVRGKRRGLKYPGFLQLTNPNPMCCHRSTLLSSDEGRNKAYNPDHTKIIRVINPEEKFVCNYQVIMTRRDQGREVVLDTSRVSIYYDSNIVGPHRDKILA